MKEEARDKIKKEEEDRTVYTRLSIGLIAVAVVCAVVGLSYKAYKIISSG